jgi:Fe-S cluster assembly scaffold protein SufB
MGIHSFLKVEKGDPDWQFSPEHYFGKEFKIIDASTIEIAEGIKDLMVLRQSPTDKSMLAKHIKLQSRVDSHMDLVIINEADAKLQQIFIYDVHLCEGSTINFGIFAKGGKFNKHIIQVTLEAGANFSAYGLMSNEVGGDTEIITKIVHQHPASTSRQFVLGHAGAGSQTVFQTMVVLDEAADGSETSVESINLNAGPKARCFSKPDVYVNCDTARSSIGSVTDSLNAEKMYYLQSRGLDPKQAATTVIKNFQNQAINLLVYNDLKEEIMQLFS